MVAGLQRIFRYLLTGTIAAILAACSSAPPPPTVVALTIKAAASVNPGPDGQPSPIMLRIYQLGGTGSFEKADFFQLNDRDTALLGADLLGKDQAVLTPGETKTMSFEVKPGTRFIGITAAYRDIDKAVWRVDVPVSGNQTTKIALSVDKLSLSADAGQ
jgi:type VI secretion system protein VasD